MNCPNCGHENPTEAEFCANCGSRLTTGVEPSPYRPFEREAPRRPSLVDRMIRAARLDVQLYEEVEADPGATSQALKVVLLVGLASGIGLLALGGGPRDLVLGVFGGIIQWAVWAYVTYLIGTRMLPTPVTHATWGQLARTTGFAQSPGVLKILGFIPLIGGVIFFGAAIWQFVAMVIAVRQALDFESTWRAVGVVAIGFVIFLVINIFFATIFGVGA